MVQMNQFAGQKLRQRCRGQTYGHQGGESGGGGGCVMNWEIGIDIYTLICIKWITNKNLLYKKINKIKFKNSKNNYGIVFGNVLMRLQAMTGGRCAQDEGTTVLQKRDLTLTLLTAGSCTIVGPLR